MLLAINLHEDFVDVEGVAVASVLSFQTPGVYSSKFDTPKSDSFSTDGDASFGEEGCYIAVAQVEAVVEPDGVGNDIWRESVAFVCIHEPILSIMGS